MGHGNSTSISAAGGITPNANSKGLLVANTALIKTFRKRLLSLCALLITAVLASCTSQETIHLGMTDNQVIKILGVPDRHAILIGKLLQDTERLESTVVLSRYRQVFIYNESDMQIWFKAGNVTGITKKGISQTR